MFNSLLGLSFSWSIKPSQNSAIKDINSIMKLIILIKMLNIFRFTSFDSTFYSTDEKILELESKVSVFELLV